MTYSDQRRVARVSTGLLAALILTVNVSGQEPAFFYNFGAVRYTEVTGVYHYVFPCKIQGQKAADSAVKYEGVCWPVFVDMVPNGAGHGVPMPPIAGVLLVSAEVVHFAPNDQANASAIPDLKPAEARFTYIRDKSLATMETRSGTLIVKLHAACEGCKPGPMTPDPAKQSQVDGEYGEIKQSLSDYVGLERRVKERAAYLNVSIAPQTQPGLGDVAEAMGLYASLNDRLAPLCQETARACVQQFSAYEGCKKTDLNAECGPPPGCESSCALTEAGFRSLGATWCGTPKDKTAILIPDWSAAGERLRARQKAYREKNSAVVLAAQTIADPNAASPASTASESATAARLDFMGKPVDPAAGCTVEQGYATAMMFASSQDVSELAGGRAATPLDVSRIAGSVAASNILTKVDPVYPAVAKAAHVSGTVLLHVLITEKGEVANLSVVSGPPLLQSAAVNAVKQWRYKPYVLDGVVRKVDTLVVVNFNFGSAAAEPSVPK